MDGNSEKVRMFRAHSVIWYIAAISVKIYNHWICILWKSSSLYFIGVRYLILKNCIFIQYFFLSAPRNSYLFPLKEEILIAPSRCSHRCRGLSFFLFFLKLLIISYFHLCCESCMPFYPYSPSYTLADSLSLSLSDPISNSFCLSVWLYLFPQKKKY